MSGRTHACALGRHAGLPRRFNAPLSPVGQDLSDEVVILWWGLLEAELCMEHGERRHGHHAPT